MTIEVANTTIKEEERRLLLLKNKNYGRSGSSSTTTTKNHRMMVCGAIMTLLAGMAVVAGYTYRMWTTHPKTNKAKESSSPWCENPNHPAVPGMYGDMGNVTLVGGTEDLPDDDPITVALFQQGLAHLYGFNQVEALRNMKAATERSPECVLCYWGVAMSYAPNINTLMVNQTKFNSAMEKAVELSAKQPALSPKTKVLVNAYSMLIVDATQPDDPDSKCRALWAQALCNNESSAIMDADIDTFCAAALMANTPWNYYQGTQGGTVYPLQPQLISAKEKLLSSVHRGDKGGPHVLAIHLLIHLLESTSAPHSYRWEALEPTFLLYNATAGSELVPSQGHLTHMPAHLLLRTGFYREAVETSKIAVANNQRYSSQCLVPYGYAHNLKMLVVNARMCGMYEDAVYYARLTEGTAAGTVPTTNGDAKCLDCAGMGSPQHVLTLARVARWEDVLSEHLPTDFGDPELAAFNKASFHLTRALAWYGLATSSREGDGSIDWELVDLADKEAQQSLAAAPKAVSEANLLNTSVHFRAELRAVRFWRVEEDYGRAIEALKELVVVDDNNIYIEPPNWYYPPRQCLGLALLQAPSPFRDVPRALEVFREDLVSFPENAWSLHGAADALEALGMPEQARTFRSRANAAWKDASFEFTSPCPQLVV